MASPKVELLRVLIAAAWTDGAISYEEMNQLKRYFLRFDLSDAEMTELEPYLADPIPEDEARHVIEDFLARARRRDRAELHGALSELLASHGELGPGETAFLRLLEDAEEARSSKLLGGLKQLWSRATHEGGRPTRRADLVHDFVQNRVLYEVKRRLLERTGTVDLDADTERDLRWVCALAALLGHVAAADDRLEERERARIAELLDRFGALQRSDVEMVVDIIDSAVLRDVGYFAFARELNEITSTSDRERLVDLLFDVAGADGHIDYHEVEEIRKISKALQLSHASFSASKERSTGVS